MPQSTLNPKIFRKYDIRGLTDEDLTPEFVRLFGRVIGDYFQEQGEEVVLIGQDNRKSSERVRDDVVIGLLASGCRIVDIGTVITPMFYYARERYDLNAGLMITGSHNPGEYNGFKIALGPATLFGEQITGIRERMESCLERGELPPEFGSVKAQMQDPDWVEMRNVQEYYLGMLSERIELGPRPLKVAVDCGNGTASLFAGDFFARLGCEPLLLYCTSDPSFPNHHPDPVQSENLSDLRDLVLRENADLGIGFDGDGDRIGVVDDSGSIIWGDILMCLFWREILPRYPGETAIIEVKCSQALVDEVERLGGRPMFYKTGHSFIKNKMRELGAVFTGEMSGHIFFADEYFGFDDALYAAGRLLRILSNSERKLSDMVADIPQYYSTAETRVPCSDEDKFDVVDALTERFKGEYEVIDVDGARVLFPEGWGLVRASNTQPAIVARCEGKTQSALEEISARTKEELESFPEVGEFEWKY